MPVRASTEAAAPVPEQAPGTLPNGFPPEAAQRYRDLGLWTGQTHWGMVEETIRRRPESLAVDDGVRRLTYAQLHDAVRVASAHLTAAGVRQGARVVVQLPNSAAFLDAVLALFRLGAVPVFALPAHGSLEVEHFCRISEATHYLGARSAGPDAAAVVQGLRERRPEVGVIAVDHRAEDPWGSGAAAAPAAGGSFEAGEPSVADEAPVPGSAGKAPVPGAVGEARGAARTPDPASTPPAAEVDPAALAFLQLSGGTTGIPKLIPRTHDDYLYSVRRSVELCDLRPDDAMLVVLPCAHNFTMSSPGILGALQVGASVVIAPDPSPSTCLRLVAEHGITQTALVPPLLLSWLNAPARSQHDLSSLRTLWVGGAKLSESVARRVAPELGCVLQQVFGMAEGLVNYTRLDDAIETVVGTQGAPMSPHDEVRILDDAGRPVPQGEPGHLQTRGPYTIRRYYRAPEHDARSFTEDGFYRTGDIVRMTPGGYLEVVGRAKDQINRGGEKVAPEAVENQLLAHDAVHDASVVGVPDEVLGEKICAYLILRPEAREQAPTLPQLRSFLRGRGLARFAMPDVLRIVEEFPQTGVGKVSKKHQRAAREG
ncbi:(2,3-dihydroxybenzoyl)adenylate synthase [Rothia halotolerans]|uniref:(2,3-dihydroxybenzoyl)adenylate synthase n=1 Tax=Rothia halotolerans TaxID=405770 RepID=UPI0013EA7F7C|nr:AMP-binding protein [Rothia halotolerans]